jgi:protein TonB
MKHGFRIVVRLHSRLGRFISGSAVAHVALAVVALILPMTRQRPVPVEDSMTVSLAGPIGGGASAPTPRVEAAPAPKPPAPVAAPPKEAHTVREVPVPKPKEKEKPLKPKKDPEPPKETAPPSDAKPDAGHDATPAAGDSKAANPDAKGPGPAIPGAPTGVTASVGGGDSSLGWYGAAVKAALESAWAKPYLEDQGATYSVVIAFDIARDGATRNVRIVTSSGIPSLDRSAQRAVIEASPLPAVPPSWDGDTLPATMRFDLSPESR